MEEVNNDQVSPHPTTPPVHRLSSSLMTLVVGVLMLIVGLSGGYFLASKNASRLPTDTKTVSQITPSPSPTEMPQPTMTPQPPEDTKDWKTYTNSDFSFKYPAEWTQSGAVISSKSPKIRLVTVSKENTLMNECMKETTTQTKKGLVLKMFTRVTTGAACEGLDATTRETWVIPTTNVFAPGISYTYSVNDAFYAENQLDKILLTFTFTK